MGQHVYKLLPQHPQLLLPLLCMDVMSHNDVALPGYKTRDMDSIGAREATAVCHRCKRRSC